MIRATVVDGIARFSRFDFVGRRSHPSTRAKSHEENQRIFYDRVRDHDVELAAYVVSAYVGANTFLTSGLSDLIADVYVVPERTVSGIAPAPAPEPLKPAVDAFARMGKRVWSDASDFSRPLLLKDVDVAPSVDR